MKKITCSSFSLVIPLSFILLLPFITKAQWMSEAEKADPCGYNKSQLKGLETQLDDTNENCMPVRKDLKLSTRM